MCFPFASFLGDRVSGLFQTIVRVGRYFYNGTIGFPLFNRFQHQWFGTVGNAILVAVANDTRWCRNRDDSFGDSAERILQYLCAFVQPGLNGFHKMLALNFGSRRRIIGRWDVNSVFPDFTFCLIDPCFGEACITDSKSWH